jgi:ABC-type multidrug transport system ATPase subunit
MSKVIEIENVSKLFNTFKAVDNLSLSIEQGEIYGFLGPNGSGKSTTLRMILGLLKPTTGTIKILGQTLDSNRAAAMQKIGCIIEKPDFYSYLSAIDNLKIFARMHGLSPKTYNFNALLQKVGLYGREKDKVKTYSHGMKQRLGLAQALLHNPEIIVLDEPNTGLDPQGIIELRETLVDLQKNEGKTIILSSHILAEIEEIASSMVLIHNGKTVAEGKINDLLNAEEMLVEIETNNTDALLNILNQASFAYHLENTTSNTIQLKISQGNIPVLIKYVANSNIEIFNISKSRKLETYFLKLTSTH